jgi:hypothetical protein
MSDDVRQSTRLGEAEEDIDRFFADGGGGEALGRMRQTLADLRRALLTRCGGRRQLIRGERRAAREQ